MGVHTRPVSPRIRPSLQRHTSSHDRFAETFKLLLSPQASDLLRHHYGSQHRAPCGATPQVVSHQVRRLSERAKGLDPVCILSLASLIMVAVCGVCACVWCVCVPIGERADACTCAPSPNTASATCTRSPP